MLYNLLYNITSISSLFVHDSMTTFSASNWFLWTNFIFSTAIFSINYIYYLKIVYKIVNIKSLNLFLI